MIMLFTRRDDLEYHRQSISQHVTTLPDKMKELIKACGNRYIAFNNRCQNPADKAAQVTDLLRMIDAMVTQNDGLCFTNDVYKEFERRINEKELKMRVMLEKQKEEGLNKAWKDSEKELKEEMVKLRREMETKTKAIEEQKQANQSLVEGISRMEREQTVILQKSLDEAREDNKNMKDKQLKDAQKLADEKQRRIEAEMNEKMNQKLRDQEDNYNDKIAGVREDIRVGIEKDKKGTGDLIIGGLKDFTVGVGQACLKVGAKLLNIVFK